MNLDEMEQFKSQNLQEGTCDIKKEKEEVFESEEPTLSDKLLDDCVAKVLKYLHGRNWETNVKEKARKKVRSIIHEALQLEVIEATESDLGETLDLLEDSLFLLERVAASNSVGEGLAADMIEHMESAADHLEQWGMGDAKNAESKILAQMKDRFRD